MTQTAAQRLYTLPEPVQESLCGLVDTIAGQDAVEKFCALDLLAGVARAWALTGADETIPAAEVLAKAQAVVGALAVEAAPAEVIAAATERFRKGAV